MVSEHIPVLLEEIVGFLRPHPDGLYVDGTLGGGGHAIKILERSSPTGRLVGIDRDEESIEVARKKLEPYEARTTIVHANFSHLREILQELNIDQVDGIVLDLGVSYHQLSDAKRGFSFQLDGPLDMRMDRTRGESASKLVNTLPRWELEGILRSYGEGRWARRITKAIVAHRGKTPIITTTQLRDIISSAIVKPTRRIHPATKAFQAIRIAVNDELNNLKNVIREGIPLLKRGARLCVISFHSLEDRIVKESFRQHERSPALMATVTKKPVLPSKREIYENPRSRSAKLRVAEKV
jgi:16S rRNA (cytosine1402-N4)-methyltransferase